MSSSDELGFADKATLRTWRAGNLLGWSFGALIVGGNTSGRDESVIVGVIARSANTTTNNRRAFG